MDNKRESNDLYFCARLVQKDFEHRVGKSVSLPERLAVFFTEDGNVTLEANGVQCEVTPLHFMIVPPGHTVRMISYDEGVVIYVLGFLPAIQDVVSKQFSVSLFYYIHTHPLWEISPRTKQALRSFYDVYEYNCNHAPGQFSTEVSNSMFSIFIQLCYQLQKSEIDVVAISDANMNTRSLGSKFFRLVHKNYKQHHNVSYYAETLCVSSKYLAQVVKQFSSRSPKDIIDTRLAAESLFLLTKTEMNIQEISNELCFPDQSYFGRFFKRMFGMSPLNYRLNPDFGLIEKITKDVPIVEVEE